MPLFDVHDIPERFVTLWVEVADDVVPVHEVDDQDSSGPDEFPVLLQDPDVRLFVVVSEGGPEVHGRIERSYGPRHALGQTSEVPDAVRRAVGHALSIREFFCAFDEGGREVDANHMVSHLGEARPVPPDAARRVEDSAARRHAEPFQDPLEVFRLRFADGPRVLMDREEDLRVTQKERLGPVVLAHRLTMLVGLFGGVARSLGIARPRLQEGRHDPSGILIANPGRQRLDLGGCIDLVVRLLRHSITGGVLRHDDVDDLRGVLFQEPGEPLDRCGLEGREGFDDEEDRSAPRDDGGLVSRNATVLVLDAEAQGPVLVVDTLPPHLRADGGLELRSARVARAGGHRRAPFTASTTAWAKADVRTSLAPGMCRARS